jgi:hypothetical protein
MVNQTVSPGTVILEAQDIVMQFRKEVSQYLQEADIREVLTQVFQGYLNQEDNDTSIFNELPEFNRMLPNRLLTESHVIISIRVSTQTLIRSIGQRLKEKGMYLNNSFSYFFEQLLGNDIVLCHLPH